MTVTDNLCCSPLQILQYNYNTGTLGWVMLFIGITELLIMPKSVRLSFWSGAKTPAHFTHPRHHWNFIFNFLASQMQTLWWVRRPWPMRSLRTILVCIRYWDIVHYLLMCSALALFGQINLWSLFTMWRGGTGMSSEFTVFWILLTATRLPLPVIQLAWNTWSESLMTSLCCRLPNSTVTCRFDMPRHTVNFQYVKHVPKKHVCRHWAATILFFLNINFTQDFWFRGLPEIFGFEFRVSALASRLV